MYKMKIDYKYSTDGVNCICVKSGDVVDLPADIAKALLSNGRCEDATVKKAAEPVENKMAEPVENKTEDKPKKTRKPRSKK